MRIEFAGHAWEDYLYWQEHDPEILTRINTLIKDITREPFKGVGKPEPLKGNLAGYWSRRITDEHRLVYRVHGIKPNQALVIVQARFHY
jgi:toxin YoeB